MKVETLQLIPQKYKGSQETTMNEYTNKLNNLEIDIFLDSYNPQIFPKLFKNLEERTLPSSFMRSALSKYQSMIRTLQKKKTAGQYP